MADPVGTIELFYSYSHLDEDMREHLEKHLSILRRTGEVTEWHDRRIDAGGEWKDQIDSHLESAKRQGGRSGGHLVAITAIHVMNSLMPSLRHGSKDVVFR